VVFDDDLRSVSLLPVYQVQLGQAQITNLMFHASSQRGREKVRLRLPGRDQYFAGGNRDG